MTNADHMDVAWKLPAITITMTKTTKWDDKPYIKFTYKPESMNE